MTTEEIHAKGCKTIDEEIENGDIIMERYEGETKDWNEMLNKYYKINQNL
jgi:hypothetical protein